MSCPACNELDEAKLCPHGIALDIGPCDHGCGQPHWIEGVAPTLKMGPGLQKMLEKSIKRQPRSYLKLVWNADDSD